MKSAGLLLSLILATALLADEPPSTTVPVDPTAPRTANPAQDAAAAKPGPAGTGGASASSDQAASNATLPALTASPVMPPTSDAKLSPSVSQMLTATLPKYEPVAPVKPVVEPSPDTIELPKVVVKQKKRPRLGDEVMMTTKAFNEKLAKEKLTSFDRNVLNKFSLPEWFGGVSAATRAREEYDREQKDQMIQDVSVIAKAVEQEDPAQAKALRDAANKP